MYQASTNPSVVPDLPAVEADVSQMQQVIMNLVINGAEAIGERTGGTVLVRTGVVELTEDEGRSEFADDQITPGAYVWLEVQDNGSGMDEATKAKIFDPFFTTKFTGRGLGLAALLGIVKGHKGVLRVHSEPGRGSNFRVLFPATMAKRVATPAEAVGEALRGTGTILVVDDENTVRQFARAALQRFGYTVLLAEHGAAGIEVLREKAAEIVLVLLDIAMPVTGGEAALEQFKCIRQDLPVVLMTGYGEAEAAQRFVGKELAGFIQKPFTVQTLLGAVSSALNALKKTGRGGI